LNLSAGSEDEWVVIATEKEHPPITRDPDDLLAQARRGDPEAFCCVARAHETRLFRQAMALCRNETASDDLVAETMFEAWSGIARFDGTCRFSTWLYAILLRRYLKSVHRARSRPVSLANVSWDEAERGERDLGEIRAECPEPNAVLARAEAADRLLAAIQGLPEIHQQVVLLRFYEDASLAEIATALGISTGTVKSRLHHGLEKLRRSDAVMDLFREERNT
jgi:RNA polymerase sigma-70 factor (ECF subfamily)